MHIAIIFLAFYYLYAKYFRFSNNQNETSEDLHNTSTVPPSCFQRTNSNHSDVTMNDSYQVMLESLSQLNRNVSLSLPAFWEKDLLAQKATDILSVSPANPPTDDKPQYKVNEYFDKQLGNMSDAVDELNRKLKKFTSDQRNKGSAPTSTISKNGLCFYHNRYGNRAHKCISSCSWHANDAMSHSQKNHLN